MKWLTLLILLPQILSAQFLLEQQELEWVENSDTLALNTITPTLLWRNFHIPKNAVFSLIEYRDAMGYIDHYDELYTLPHWDTALVHFIQELLPLSQAGSVHKGKIKSYARFAPTRWTLQSTLQYSTESITGILHQRVAESGRNTTGTVAHNYRIGRTAQLYTLVGAHKITAGQGLLLGSSSFPSLTSSEVFARGIQPKTGAGNYPHEGTGAAISLSMKDIHLNYSFTHEHSSRTSINYKGSYGVVGFASDTVQQSVFYKVYQNNIRWFGEHTLDKHAVGCNVFLSDVLFEYNTYWELGVFSSRFHMSWRNRAGSYFIKREQKKLRGVYQGKHVSVFVSQHLEEQQSSYRWRMDVHFARNSTLQLHYHQGTRGITLREKRKHADWQLEGALALIEYENHPVWISHPIAFGNIGATGIFKDYAGVHLRAKYQSLDMSVHWNALFPSSPQLKLSHTLRF